MGAALTAPYFVLVRFDQHDVRYGAIALIMTLTVPVSAALGLALSTVLPRELEGTLVLLVVVGLQMMMDPDGTASRVLPFWYTREIATYAIDHADGGYLARGLLHGVLAVAVLTALVAVAWRVREGRRSHLEFIPIR